MENIVYYIGQFLGVVAIILGFISYQMKTQKGVLIVQCSTTVVFFTHYFLIGAYSGMALNMVAFVRNLTFFQLSKKGKIGKGWAILYAVIMGGVGACAWEAWYSVFVVFGLIINSYCMSFSNPQNIRKSILVTSPMVLIYDGFVLSVGGLVYESVAIISSVIGLLRNVGKDKKEKSVSDEKLEQIGE